MSSQESFRDVESTVLGGVIGGNINFQDVRDTLDVNDFSIQQHQLIYKALDFLDKKGGTPDLLSLTTYLEGEGILSKAGSREYLFQIVEGAQGFNEANMRGFIKLVSERSTQRYLSGFGEKVQNLVEKKKAMSSQELIEMVQSDLSTLITQRAGLNIKKTQSLSEVMDIVIDDVEQIVNNAGARIGLSWGLDSLDDQTMGLHPGDLVIVAARPGMGKTTLAMGAIAHNSLIEREPTLVFSMEMPSDQLVKRMIANYAQVPVDKFRRGGFTGPEIKAMHDAAERYRFHDAPLYIHDEGGIKFSKLKRVASEYKQQYGIKLIMIDYLQLMGYDVMTGNKANDIGEITKNLKSLAKELELPIILLSQLNRDLEKRPNKRPVNSDLRDSGSIEQDADTIMMIYRDDYYNPNSPDKGVTECILTKQRNGPQGTSKVGFNGGQNRFYDFGKSADQNIKMPPDFKARGDQPPAIPAKQLNPRKLNSPTGDDIESGTFFREHNDSANLEAIGKTDAPFDLELGVTQNVIQDQHRLDDELAPIPAIDKYELEESVEEIEQVPAMKLPKQLDDPFGGDTFEF